MTASNELGIVIKLACLTEDRAPDEQRAMLAVALRLDTELGEFVGTNRELQMPRYVGWVQNTYSPSEGKRVDLTKSQREKYDRLLERWAMCPTCNWPMGAHGLTNDDRPRCPDLPGVLERLRAAVQR